MFHDTAPRHRLPEPTRADCAAADEARAQHTAAVRGTACYAVVEDLSALLDRFPGQWRADDAVLINDILALLTEARALSERLT